MKAGRKKRRRGRPGKFSPEIGGHICAAIQRGCTHEVAAMSAGIGERTLYDWLRQFPHFSQALKKAHGLAVFHATSLLIKHAQHDWRAAAVWLERMCPEEWGRPRDRVFVVAQDPAQPMNDAERNRELRQIYGLPSTTAPTLEGRPQ